MLSLLGEQDLDIRMLNLMTLNGTTNAMWEKGADKKQKKRQVWVIEDFMYVLEELSWWFILGLEALWWSMTEQDNSDSKTQFISKGE